MHWYQIHTVSSRRAETYHDEGTDPQPLYYNNIASNNVRSPRSQSIRINVQSPPNGRNGKTGVGRARTIGALVTAAVAVAVTI